MTRLAALSLAAVLAGAALLSLAPGDGRAAPPKLRIATDGAYPPFSMVTPEGELAGFDVDIARALCAAVEVECEIIQHDWDGMIPGLMADKFDAVVASMAITEERRARVDFTRKYYISPARFISARGAQIEISPEGLAGRIACVQGGTIHENYLRGSFPGLEIQTYRTQQDATFDLAAGRCDVLLGEAVVLSGGFLKQPEGAAFGYVGPSVADPRWYGEGAGIAVRKGNTELVELFNRAIDAIRADGTYARINDKYFDFDLYGE